MKQADFCLLLLLLLLNLFSSYPSKGFPESFKQFGKRLGPAIQWNLALQFIFVTKKSPILNFLGVSYERVNIYHQWIGRWIGFLMCIHAIGFLLDWASKGVVIEKLSKPRNLYGLLALLLWMLMFVTSLTSVRTKFYRIFFIFHMVSFPFTLYSLLQHYQSETLIIVVIVPLLSWLWNIIATFGFSTHQVSVLKSTVVGEDEAVILETAVPCAGLEYSPGQHVLLQVPSLSKIGFHPFTIATMPSSPTLKFIIAVRSQWTLQLLKLVKSGRLDRICFHGPYGSLDVNLRRSQSVVFISGGVGCSFTLPLLQYTLNTTAARCTYICSMKKTSLFDELSSDLATLCELTNSLDLKVHFTGGTTTGIELSHASRLKGGKFSIGRADLEKELISERDKCKQNGENETCVVVCGPATMGLQVQAVVRRLNQDNTHKKHYFALHVENFAL